MLTQKPLSVLASVRRQAIVRFTSINQRKLNKISHIYAGDSYNEDVIFKLFRDSLRFSNQSQTIFLGNFWSKESSLKQNWSWFDLISKKYFYPLEMWLKKLYFIFMSEVDIWYCEGLFTTVSGAKVYNYSLINKTISNRDLLARKCEITEIMRSMNLNRYYKCEFIASKCFVFSYLLYEWVSIFAVQDLRNVRDSNPGSIPWLCWHHYQLRRQMVI